MTFDDKRTQARGACSFGEGTKRASWLLLLLVVACSSEVASDSAGSGGSSASPVMEDPASSGGSFASSGGAAAGGSPFATGGEPTTVGAGGQIEIPPACELDQARVYNDVAYFASDELRGREPGDVGNELALQFAEQQFAEAGLSPGGDDDTFRQSFEFASGKWTDNVLAVLPGTDPLLREEVIIIGAHIDHLGLADNDQIYSGADDNASGSAVVLELARMFSRCDLSPKRTLVFVQWNAEEKGILGSRYYVDHPIYPLESTIAVYNFDMVGAGDGTGVLLFGGHDDENLFLTELMEEAASEADLNYTIQIVPQKMASDHAPFVEEGIPICWGFARPDPHPGYHSPADNIEGIKPESLKAVTELFWAALRPLALGEEDLYLN